MKEIKQEKSKVSMDLKNKNFSNSQREIDEYTVEADGVKVDVKIFGGKGKSKVYNLIVPELSKPTLALVDDVKRELITEVKVSAAEILDPKIINKLKQKFREKAGELLKEKLPRIKEETKGFLVGILLHDMLGFGKIEFLLNDGNLEEIVINSADEPIRLYHKRHGWLETNIVIEMEEKI